MSRLQRVAQPARYGAAYLQPPPAAGGGGVSLPTPTAYYPLSNGNDVCASPANFSTYSAGTNGLVGAGGSWNGLVSRQTSTGSKFNPAGGDWTLAYWLYFPTTSNNYLPLFLISAGLGNYPKIECDYVPTGAGVTVYYNPDLKTNYQVSVPSSNALAAATWHLIVARHTGGQLGVSVDNGTEATVSCPAVSVTDPSLFYVRNYTSAGLSLDEIGWWKGAALSSGQRTTLYNAGAGRTFDGSVWT